jgi:1,4-dihydroxy-2-naphthoate octaprenyltransferase
MNNYLKESCVPGFNFRVAIRALRLPFLSASVLPFIAGYFFAAEPFVWATFATGVLAVALTHTGANLINDYADSQSGADWADRQNYVFFGGSKLIQEGVLSEKFYLYGAWVCFAGAFCAIVFLSWLLSTYMIFLYAFVILGLSYVYSQKPFQFCYHRLGELILFILFGPALVMGGYYIQTTTFPHGPSFVLSLPFAFLTTAILFANEVPDYETDKAAGKMTWVSITGAQNAYLLYAALMMLGFVSIVVNVYLGYLNGVAFFSFLLLVPAVKAMRILQTSFKDKTRMMTSSQLTVQAQMITSLILIVSVWL